MSNLGRFTCDTWAVYHDDRGYTAEPDRGHIVDLGGKIPSRRLKMYLTRSLAERLARKYNEAKRKE